MSRLVPVPEPSIIRHAPDPERFRKRRTFTGLVGAACMLPLRAIIDLCVRLRIHPNTLTLIGVIINVGAAWALGFGRFLLAFFIMLVANIFDFIDGKVAHIAQLQSEFGAFWDSTLDRFSEAPVLSGSADARDSDLLEDVGSGDHPLGYRAARAWNSGERKA